jgi:hypothetical protein
VIKTIIWIIPLLIEISPFTSKQVKRKTEITTNANKTRLPHSIYHEKNESPCTNLNYVHKGDS